MAQSYAGFVCLYAWMSNSFPRPPSKRAVAVALINAFSQLGNIAGSYVWPKTWGPTYRNSYAVSPILCILVEQRVMCRVVDLYSHLWLRDHHVLDIPHAVEEHEQEIGGRGEGKRLTAWVQIYFVTSYKQQLLYLTMIFYQECLS